MHAIDVRNGYARQFLFRDSFEATDIDAVHLAHRRLIADAKDANTAMPAEIVVVLFLSKDVADQLTLTRDDAEVIGRGNCRPESIAPAYGAVASITGLGQIKIRFDRDLAAVAGCPVGS